MTTPNLAEPNEAQKTFAEILSKSKPQQAAVSPPNEQPEKSGAEQTKKLRDQVSTPYPLKAFPISKLKEIAERAAKEDGYLVEGLITGSSIVLLVGDSGTGKSPLAYQLAYAVASGKPFLGQPVKQGSVLYLDLENGALSLDPVSDAIAAFHQLKKQPDNLHVQFDRPGSWEELEYTIKQLDIKLVVIDSLFAFRPEAVEKNKDACNFMATVRAIARAHKCVILIVHHIKKPPTGFLTPDIEIGPLMGWLNDASGARALVNESDLRFGFAMKRDGQKINEDMLVLRGHQRLTGDAGTRYLRRVPDENGDPLGYELASDLALLNDPGQQTVFLNLPAQFAFKEAKAFYGKSDDPTNKFLKKLEGLGLLRKIKRGVYKKTPQGLSLGGRVDRVTG